MSSSSRSFHPFPPPLIFVVDSITQHRIALHRLYSKVLSEVLLQLLLLLCLFPVCSDNQVARMTMIQ
jgi:hypothetical protein